MWDTGSHPPSCDSMAAFCLPSVRSAGMGGGRRGRARNQPRTIDFTGQAHLRHDAPAGARRAWITPPSFSPHSAFSPYSEPLQLQDYKWHSGVCWGSRRVPSWGPQARRRVRRFSYCWGRAILGIGAPSHVVTTFSYCGRRRCILTRFHRRRPHYGRAFTSEWRL
jgi:hypothetical protein